PRFCASSSRRGVAGSVFSACEKNGMLDSLGNPCATPSVVVRRACHLNPLRVQTVVQLSARWDGFFPPEFLEGA
ncbi:MAG: hypothetical protein RMM51_12285, partial [Verrucomicrobiae bacterium]|nr:hypothetical protein [Verrucomicrobiae bacterium]